MKVNTIVGKIRIVLNMSH